MKDAKYEIKMLKAFPDLENVIHYIDCYFTTLRRSRKTAVNILMTLVNGDLNDGKRIIPNTSQHHMNKLFNKFILNLDQIHMKNYVLSDLKPANIGIIVDMIIDEDTPCVKGFGRSINTIKNKLCLNELKIIDLGAFMIHGDLNNQVQAITLYYAPVECIVPFRLRRTNQQRKKYLITTGLAIRYLDYYSFFITLLDIELSTSK